MPEALRVAFVTGTTPDKWVRAWREQRRGPLELVPVTEDTEAPEVIHAAVRDP